jgi:hypothetical protein
LKQYKEPPETGCNCFRGLLLPTVTGRIVYLLRTVAVDEYCVLTDYVNVTPGDNNVLTFAEETHHSAFSVNDDGNQLAARNVNFNVVNIAESGTVGFADYFLVS